MGQYAVRSEVGGTQAVLLASDGRAGIVVPITSIQVRAPANGDQDPALAIIANLCFGGSGSDDLCFFGEPQT